MGAIVSMEGQASSAQQIASVDCQAMHWHWQILESIGGYQINWRKTNMDNLGKHLSPAFTSFHENGRPGNSGWQSSPWAVKVGRGKNHGRQLFVPGVGFRQPMAMTGGKSGIEDRSGIWGGGAAISQLPLQLLMGGERGPPRESSSDLPLGKGGWVVEREVWAGWRGIRG